MGRQEALNDYWSGRARYYHREQVTGQRADLERELWLNALADVFPVAPGTALDVGTGSGYLAFLLADLGFRVTGIDSAEGMLREARAEAKRRAADGLPVCNFQLGDAIHPEKGVRGVDVVTSRYLMWTLSDPLEALRNWRDAVRPGGMVLVADANHHPAGLDKPVSVNSDYAPDSFTSIYGAVKSELPLSEVKSPDPYLDLFREAGLQEITMVPLPEIRRHKEIHGMAPGHELVEPFLVHGLAPE